MEIIRHTTLHKGARQAAPAAESSVIPLLQLCYRRKPRSTSSKSCKNVRDRDFFPFCTYAGRTEIGEDPERETEYDNRNPGGKC